MLKRRIVFFVILAVVILIGLYALAQVGVNIFNMEQTAASERSPAELQQSFEQVPNPSNENQVIAIMGSKFKVDKCSPTALEGNQVCAHIYHYQAEDDAWDFMFDMDGNLMSKKIGSIE